MNVKKKIKMLVASFFIGVLISVTGCLATVDTQNPKQKLLAATTIQVATSAFLENNREAASVVMYVTETAIVYFKTPEVVAYTVDQLKDYVHSYIDGLDLIMTSKIGLKGLVDILFAEALKWTNLTVTQQLNPEAMKVFVWCAEQMNIVAKMYIQEDFKEIITTEL